VAIIARQDRKRGIREVMEQIPLRSTQEVDNGALGIRRERISPTPWPRSSNAVGQGEKKLTQTAWAAGARLHARDHQLFSLAGMMVEEVPRN